MPAAPSFPDAHLSCSHTGGRAGAGHCLAPVQVDGHVAQIRLRTLSVEDTDALVRTVERCSPDSRRARFHEALSTLPVGWARTICKVDDRRVVVAAVVEGLHHRLADELTASLGAPYEDEIVALVQIEPDVGGAELAILVEDAYQRSGVGSLVLCAALAEAARNGTNRIKAHILPDNDGIRRLLTSTDLPVRRGHDDGKECWFLDTSGLLTR